MSLWHGQGTSLTVTGYSSGGAVRAGVMVHVVLGTMLDGSEWLSLWCQEKAWRLITE